jgi:hypothetical protein
LSSWRIGSATFRIGLVIGEYVVVSFAAGTVSVIPSDGVRTHAGRTYACRECHPGWELDMEGCAGMLIACGLLQPWAEDIWCYCGTGLLLGRGLREGRLGIGRERCGSSSTGREDVKELISSQRRQSTEVAAGGAGGATSTELGVVVV